LPTRLAGASGAFVVYCDVRYFLNGFMGSGKSHWGRRWGKLFNLDFYDLDSVIEIQEGKTIRQIFETEGEKAFRLKESKALSGLCARENVIIACGGGTPCFHHNMRLMDKAGITIFLKAPVADLVARLIPELEHRPVLHGNTADTLPAFIGMKLAERTPFYDGCMYHFNTRYLTDENFKKIVDKCKKL
jgi:shikimate kinase